ncbi:MAG: hypothetical protein OXG43_11535 [Chloroflexi bacterium]|nr:hypothetical protein [Chloroflexota bacterium]
MRTTILCKLPGRNTCAQVAAADLRGITGALNLFRMRRTALNARDFRGLTGLDALWLNHNSLATRPADLFDVLTNLCGFYLANSPGSSFTFTATVAQTAPTLVKVTVRVTAAGFPASGVTHSGIRTGVGTSNQAPTVNSGPELRGPAERCERRLQYLHPHRHQRYRRPRPHNHPGPHGH